MENPFDEINQKLSRIENLLMRIREDKKNSGN